ncbi:MAG: LpqB family beta-propeller domain-containing protein [Actinomycetes bacterium]
MTSRRSALTLVAVAALALAGCSEIPTSGPVVRGDEVRAVVDEPAVRVLPRDPVVGQSPEEVVSGFLEASASFVNDHEVARRFLSPSAAETWNAEAGVTVIDDSPDYRLERVRGGVRLMARQVARIGADGAYHPRDEVEIEPIFELDRVGDSWRITELPPGLILDRIETSLALRAYELYFMNPERTLLVPDPVYLPLDQTGSATRLVKSLLVGPTRWLSPAVQSVIPSGTTLVVDSVPIENGVARVDLSADFLESDVEEREQAAAQITMTLLGLSSTVTGVAISVQGEPLLLPVAPAVMTRETWETYDPDRLTPALGALFVRGGVVRRLTDDGSGPVPGPLGAIQTTLAQPSQSWDGGTVTALANGGRTLLVSHPFVSARVQERLRGQELLPASLDAEDRVWAVDVGSAKPRVQLLDGARAWEQVQVRGLHGRLEAFRVSVDGTRVAVVIDPRKGSGEQGELLFGRVVRRTDGLRIEAFRRVERTLVDVRDVSWIDASSLVVLGGTVGSVLEPTLVDVNRSVSSLSGSPAVGIRSVSAASGVPLLAGTPRDGVWVESASAWAFLVRGRDPAYPG